MSLRPVLPSRLAHAILFALFCLVAFAACGGSDAEDAADEVPAEEDAAEGDDAAGDEVVAEEPADTTPPSTVPPEPSMAEATFTVQESVGQLTVRGAEGGTDLVVLDGDMTIAEATTDDDGDVVIHYVPAGTGYTVAHADGSAGITDITVSDIAGSIPDQAFYDGQTIDEGFTYIEMRDGTTLSAYIVFPGPPEDGPYPTVVEYSGYTPSDPISGIGIGGDGFDPTPFCGAIPVLCKAPTQVSSLLAGLRGYAVVGVNVRGSGCSGGAYDFFDDAQLADGYDVIEAVAAQPWVKGNKVGMVGLSYPGISQMYVASTQPPSLSAIAPLSIIGDSGNGVIRPGGLLNVGFATSWADAVSTDAADGTGWENEIIAGGDTQCEDNMSLRNHGVDLIARIRDNPWYTPEVGGRVDGRTFVDKINVPVYLTSQWQDEQTGGAFDVILDKFTSSPYARFDLANGAHVDGYAPYRIDEWKAFLDIYVAEEVPSFNPLFSSAIAPVLFGAIFNVEPGIPENRWTDVSTVDEARAKWESEAPVKVTFESGAGTDEPGSPVGTFTAEFASWPPPETEGVRWFLQPDGSLAPTEPDADGGASQFARDNAAAERTYYEGGTGGLFAALPPYEWAPEVAGNALVFDGPTLTEDLGLVGTASIDLWVQADADNTDIEVVVSEIRPDGTEMLVQTGFLNTEYRSLTDDSTEFLAIPSGLEAEKATLADGEWTQVRISTHAFAHVFRAGSSLRLTIDTPGDDEPLWAWELPERPDGLITRVGHNADTASSILLPVIPALEAPGDVAPCPSLRGQPCRPAVALPNTPAE